MGGGGSYLASHCKSPLQPILGSEFHESAFHIPGVMEAVQAHFHNLYIAHLQQLIGGGVGTQSGKVKPPAVKKPSLPLHFKIFS